MATISIYGHLMPAMAGTTFSITMKNIWKDWAKNQSTTRKSGMAKTGATSNTNKKIS